MRTHRHNKFVLGLKHYLKGDSLHYQYSMSQGILCRCQFEVWKKQLFEQLEKGPGLQLMAEQLMGWVELPSEMLGKRSAQIVLSKSKQYCLKMIEQEDLQKMNEMLEQYAKFKQKKQVSLLVPIIAVIRVHSCLINKKPTIDSYIVMPNIKLNDPTVFDIKGHCDNRLVDQSDFKIFRFGKDQNFIKSHLKDLLRELPAAQIKNMLKQVSENLQFLKNSHIIDYSLLLMFGQGPTIGNNGMKHVQLVGQQWVQWGIIDFMQVYNQRKKLENRVKSLFFKEVSSVDPQTYAQRLMHFLEKCLLE